jgi:hypothetical protein
MDFLYCIAKEIKLPNFRKDVGQSEKRSTRNPGYCLCASPRLVNDLHQFWFQMANYQPLPTVNKDEDHETLQDSRYSQDDGEESALIYKSKHDYAELEVDDSSAHEEAPLSQVPSDPTLDTALRLPTDGGSIFESFVNMANSIVGAGIIGLPFAFKEAVSYSSACQ